MFGVFVPLLMTLSAIPFYLLGLCLIYLLALVWPNFPTAGRLPPARDWRDPAGWSATSEARDFARRVHRARGDWLLGPGHACADDQHAGEDFMSFAQPKDSAGARSFSSTDCAMRCCRSHRAGIALAASCPGAILVEVVFAYPGIGFLLFRAISGNDYFVIQGVVLFIILSVGLSLLILDLLYPFLDPRIQTRRG